MTILPKVQDLGGADKTQLKHIEVVDVTAVTPLDENVSLEKPSISLDRTLSQDVAARTGRSRIACRAALDALADDPQRDEKAYNLLMSNLVLTVFDGLPCEAVPFCSGEDVWLPSIHDALEKDGETSSATTAVDVGGFKDCYLLRIERGREKDLRIFALEPVQVVLLSRQQEGSLWRDRSIDVPPGWDTVPTSELNSLPVLSDEAGESKWLEMRNFDPGSISIPLQAGSDIVPLVRILKKPIVSPVRPPANSVMQSAQMESRLEEASQSQRLEVLPEVPEDDDELEEDEDEEEEEQEASAKEAKRVAAKDSSEQVVGDVDRQRQTAQVASERPTQRARKHRRLKEQREHVRPQLTYILGKKIGEGAFGTVFVAEAVDEASNKQKVAVKCVLPVDGRETREVSILKRLQHPFIIPLLDSYTSSDGKQAIHIVMEFMPSSLHDRIGGQPLPASDLLRYSFQLLRALAHLDGLGIAHRDLKPQNVLVDGSALKLADFGSAKELDGKASISYICSRWWRAPELILGSAGYTTSVDWWSCGCVIAEMMLGKSIFRGASNTGQMFEIISVLGAPTREELRALGSGCKQLQDNLAKLVKPHRPATNWASEVPSYAGYPLALELLAQLLVWLPSNRLHPAHALSQSCFTELLDADQRSTMAFLYTGFSDEELSSLSPEAKAKFRDLEESVKRPMRKREHPVAPSTQTEDVTRRPSSSQPEPDSLDTADTKRRRLNSEQASAQIPQPVKDAEVKSSYVGKDLEESVELAGDASMRSAVTRDASMRSAGSLLREAQMMDVETPATDEL